MNKRVRYLLTLPERLVRVIAAAGGGAVHETAELVLPRLVRKSRLYEATAKNLLRITVELVGGVDRPNEEIAGEFEPSPKKLVVRKSAGNVVELGSIFAFGFSPLWLLAAAADVTHGTRVYLDALVDELKLAGHRRTECRAPVRRRSARSARGRERYDRAPDRHPAARGRSAQAVAVGPARRRRRTADSG